MKHLRTLLFLLLVSGPLFAANDVYVIHFILDGAQKAFLDEQIEKGELPNLKKYFFDNGAVFEKAITTFPTVSFPGYVSFTTGLSAGNSGIFFLEWFDRTNQRPVGYLTPNGYNRIDSDLLNSLNLKDVEAKELYPPTTLFEKLSPEPTAAVYTPVNRGASIITPKKFPVGGLWNTLVTQDGLQLNVSAMKEMDKLFSEPLPKIPRYSLVGLYGTDFYGHHAGPQSEEVAMVLKQFDTLFANFAEQLKGRGILDKTYFVVSSDHGMHTTGKLSKLKEELWKKGISSKDRVYMSNRGVASTFVYVGNNDDGWDTLPTLNELQNFQSRKGPVDLIQTFLGNESVDWLAAREDLDRVRVFDRNGEGLIVRLNIGGQTFYSYSYQNQDPLGFGADPKLASLLNGKPYSAETWFQKTAGTSRPNAVVELSNIFQDPRAGDILVVAKAPWSFRTAKAGTHGDFSPADMNIPLWIAGPGIPNQKGGEAKSVDLFPTILNWFGVLQNNDLKNQEGKVLFARPEKNQPETANLWLAKLEQEMATKPSLAKIPDGSEVTDRLNKLIPAGMKESVRKQCEQEVEIRYQRWKKFDQLQEALKEDGNPLQVPKNLKKNMGWLFANEKNIEFMRLRRMEDIQSILKNP